MLILLVNRQGKPKRGRQAWDSYLFREAGTPQRGARTVPVRSAWAGRGAQEKADVLRPDNPLRTGTVRGAMQCDVPAGLNRYSDSSEACSLFSENPHPLETLGSAAALAAPAGGVGRWTFNVQGLPPQNANDAEGVALADYLSSLGSFAAKSIMADRRDALSYGALDELRNSAILLIAATSKI